MNLVGPGREALRQYLLAVGRQAMHLPPEQRKQLVLAVQEQVLARLREAGALTPTPAEVAEAMDAQGPPTVAAWEMMRRLGLPAGPAMAPPAPLLPPVQLAGTSGPAPPQARRPVIEPPIPLLVSPALPAALPVAALPPVPVARSGRPGGPPLKFRLSIESAALTIPSGTFSATATPKGLELRPALGGEVQGRIAVGLPLRRIGRRQFQLEAHGGRANLTVGYNPSRYSARLDNDLVEYFARRRPMLYHCDYHPPAWLWLVLLVPQLPMLLALIPFKHSLWLDLSMAAFFAGGVFLISLESLPSFARALIGGGTVMLSLFAVGLLVVLGALNPRHVTPKPVQADIWGKMAPVPGAQPRSPRDRPAPLNDPHAPRPPPPQAPAPQPATRPALATSSRPSAWTPGFSTSRPTPSSGWTVRPSSRPAPPPRPRGTSSGPTSSPAGWRAGIERAMRGPASQPSSTP